MDRILLSYSPSNNDVKPTRSVIYETCTQYTVLGGPSLKSKDWSQDASASIWSFEPRLRTTINHWHQCLSPVGRYASEWSVQKQAYPSRGRAQHPYYLLQSMSKIPQIKLNNGIVIPAIGEYRGSFDVKWLVNNLISYLVGTGSWAPNTVEEQSKVKGWILTALQVSVVTVYCRPFDHQRLKDRVRS